MFNKSGVSIRLRVQTFVSCRTIKYTKQASICRSRTYKIKYDIFLKSAVQMHTISYVNKTFQF